jgi:hypothetical protein
VLLTPCGDDCVSHGRHTLQFPVESRILPMLGRLCQRAGPPDWG